MGSLLNKNIFITGGLGFIGSHTSLVLVENGAKITIIDNLNNSFIRVLSHMKKLAGDKADQINFVECDIRDKAKLTELFSKEKYDCVIHFAGYKAVGESVEKPLEYYVNNFVGTTILLEVLREFNCKNMVFSSSCTVYGIPEKVPIDESSSLCAISPYGRTKLFQEEMFRDLAVSDKAWNILLLRYFNPIGAHPSGEIGENPVGIPNNLMPYIQGVALGQRERLNVFGDDYPTPDGTAIRDYIHVMDLANGHVAAVSKLLKVEAAGESWGCKAINLGTGKGTSVLEMIKAFEEASGVKVKYAIAPRREGDSTAVWATTDLALKELGWSCKYGIKEMCEHQWAWASKYPKGFSTPVAEDTA
uniref:UDP-glucose 4-epimerase n=1 Tax=Polytomella parva TaxID=51329 RepID=A0A7S0YIF0_9CHLO|mmetsp:Transcript_31228/g.56690  ORF Transcript_31228/g.56690 Transcript_31228/m.56690 type:complete len:360 (+) Transcript_31228:58-1137(+)|eukprot:CAMPEP_0175066984 /NCGR_PEP_ID=MMETSP0052_2-20121109/16827_1 /TAXON_ID=51329 ORGANISM="Polytomella parva, Strain SAG 63-3" /NCGR_SAMPLE_ID=MMETSP0052_2 /ASSEMBLY_ACC=CAM_ASM_000194 /LENGTH=359 /DNA_ID=CAMNT_0016333777 /DNA_START=38 /DNA_END=1117 /DNA_ORIENTATION=-